MSTLLASEMSLQADVDEHPNLTFFKLRYQSLTRSSFSNDGVAMSMSLLDNDGVAMSMSLLDVLEPLCARGFLRQATRLSLTSKAVAAALPMGTGKQIYEAAKAGNDGQLTVYLEFWRDSVESPKVLNWAPLQSVNDSPLLAAAMNRRLACVELLVTLAPAVDVNKGAGTALHFASDHGNAKMARVLLAAPGIDVNKSCHGHGNPLLCAVDNGHADVVRLLVAVKGIDLEPKDYKGLTPMCVAEKELHRLAERIEDFEQCISERCDKLLPIVNRTLTCDEMEQLLPLYLAKQQICQEIIAILTEALEKKKEADEKEKVLDVAGKQLWNAARSGVMARLRPLVDKWSGNADMLNWADPSRGFTPIHGAIYMSRLEAVQLLASTPGVDINKTDKEGWTPLIASVFIGNVDIVRFLLSVDGIDVNKKILVDFRTALTMASNRASGETDEKWAMKQEISVLLRAAGAR